MQGDGVDFGQDGEDAARLMTKNGHGGARTGTPWTARERLELMRIVASTTTSSKAKTDPESAVWKRIARALGTGRSRASVRAEYQRVASSNFERSTGKGKGFHQLCKKCGMQKRGHICPVELAQQQATKTAGVCEGVDACMQPDHQEQQENRALQDALQGALQDALQDLLQDADEQELFEFAKSLSCETQ